MRILLLLVALPILELAGMIEMGQAIGTLPTLGLLFLGVLLGALLLRSLGTQTALRLRLALARQEDPSGPLLSALFAAVAALLLIFPGFLTDAAALILLVPPVQTLIGRSLWRFAEKRGARFAPSGPIDVEWTEVDEDEDDRDAPARLPPSERRASSRRP